MTTLALFHSYNAAEEAVRDLNEKGFKNKDISVVMRDTDEARNLVKSTKSKIGKGAAGGATTGGIIGGIAGLLIGLGVITIPGIGGVLVAGPLLAALGITGAVGSTISGAATGALAGGLIGGLLALGLDEKTAKDYEQGVKEGDILLTVKTDKAHKAEIENILHQHEATKVHTVAES